MSDTPKVNLVINQGATFRHKFTWQDAKKRPINLTGYTARMHVRLLHSTPGTPLLELTTANNGIVLGGALGTISLVSTATATAAMVWTKGVYDIELQSATGEVTRLVGGSIVVTPEVTKA